MLRQIADIVNELDEQGDTMQRPADLRYHVRWQEVHFDPIKKSRQVVTAEKQFLSEDQFELWVLKLQGAGRQEVSRSGNLRLDNFQAWVE